MDESRWKFRFRLLGAYAWRGPWLRSAMGFCKNYPTLIFLGFLASFGLAIFSEDGRWLAQLLTLGVPIPHRPEVSAMAQAVIWTWWTLAVGAGLWLPMSPASKCSGAGPIVPDALMALTGALWASARVEGEAMKKAWALMERAARPGSPLPLQAMGLAGFGAQWALAGAATLKLIMGLSLAIWIVLGLFASPWPGQFEMVAVGLGIAAASFIRHAPWGAWRDRLIALRRARPQASPRTAPSSRSRLDSVFESIAHSLERQGALSGVESRELREQAKAEAPSKPASRL